MQNSDSHSLLAHPQFFFPSAVPLAVVLLPASHIADNGAVTLKGPVDSDTEKQAVEAKASQIAGSDKVTSELQVKSK